MEPFDLTQREQTLIERKADGQGRTLSSILFSFISFINASYCWTFYSKENGPSISVSPASFKIGMLINAEYFIWEWWENMVITKIFFGVDWYKTINSSNYACNIRQRLTK